MLCIHKSLHPTSEVTWQKAVLVIYCTESGYMKG